MQFAIDWLRLAAFIGVPLLMLLAFVRHHRRQKLPGAVEQEPSPSRTARRGMLGMTFMGLTAGVLGSVGENFLGDTAPIHVLYWLCMLGLAPMRPFPWLSSTFGLHAYPLLELATFVGGLAAVPATWYLVFLGIGHLMHHSRRTR